MTPAPARREERLVYICWYVSLNAAKLTEKLNDALGTRDAVVDVSMHHNGYTAFVELGTVALKRRLLAMAGLIESYHGPAQPVLWLGLSINTFQERGRRGVYSSQWYL